MTDSGVIGFINTSATVNSGINVAFIGGIKKDIAENSRIKFDVPGGTGPLAQMQGNLVLHITSGKALALSAGQTQRVFNVRLFDTAPKAVILIIGTEIANAPANLHR